MSDSLFKELDLERHGRLLWRALGAPMPIAICDRAGEVVWATGGASGGAGIEEVISELSSGQGGLPPAGGRTELVDGDLESLLLCSPIRAGAQGEIGWLALLVDRRPASGEIEALEETLADVAAAIAGEYRLNSEITGLVDELSGRYEELNLVYTLEGKASALGQGTAGSQVLLEGLAESLNADLAAFVLSGRRAPIYATHTSNPIPNLDLVLTQLRDDVFRFVAAGRKPLILNERDDPRRQYLFIDMPYRLLACPVASGSSMDAMLVLLRHADRPAFSNGDRNLGMVIASQTAIVMRNQEMLGELQEFAQQMAAALIEAVEAKDPYTRGHSERVQAISTQIARGAGLAAADVEDISWGALLHDVGKIGIPDRVLRKAGRLTEDEYTLIKIHPERSYEILRHIEYLGENALAAARHHQERFDGTGYPRGLAGRKIPLLARVVAVADTYDAMTSSRAFRAGRSHEVAMVELRRVAGTQLDPEFVDVFEKLCGDDTRWLEEITTGCVTPDE